MCPHSRQAALATIACREETRPSQTPHQTQNSNTRGPGTIYGRKVFHGGGFKNSNSNEPITNKQLSKPPTSPASNRPSWLVVLHTKYTYPSPNLQGSNVALVLFAEAGKETHSEAQNIAETDAQKCTQKKKKTWGVAAWSTWSASRGDNALQSCLASCDVAGVVNGGS